LPLTAALLTLVLLSAGIVYFLYPRFKAGPARVTAETITQHIKAGRIALARGGFRLAVHELQTAQSLAERIGEPVPGIDRSWLAQWLLQAHLLADLLDSSLEEIVSHASHLEPDDKAWFADFDQRYRGRSVVFDAEVRRDAAGKYQMNYLVVVDGKQAVLDLTNVQLFKLLPLHKPQRLLFGLRLASVRREAEGSWVIRFDPNRGVLLTDREAAAACSPQTAAELDELVRRQAGWLGLSSQ
jgi:hypothetical protein